MAGKLEVSIVKPKVLIVTPGIYRVLARSFYHGDAGLLRRPDEHGAYVLRREIADNGIETRLYGFEIFLAVIDGPVVEKRARGIPHRVNNGIMSEPYGGQADRSKICRLSHFATAFPNFREHVSIFAISVPDGKHC
ncbi:hypothetical protein GGQ65_000418 [Rhizobium fabae]|uniref:Uncharacterized protein n=1 Tax=Rhizobium fabae TaxID=573179 RepID=A0A7W6B0E2_9HYPH|nr:hypothetical protein [Rhizobium fabae]